jgi:hypothetical protein
MVGCMFEVLDLGYSPNFSEGTLDDYMHQVYEDGYSGGRYCLPRWKHRESLSNPNHMMS